MAYSCHACGINNENIFDVFTYVYDLIQAIFTYVYDLIQAIFHGSINNLAYIQ